MKPTLLRRHKWNDYYFVLRTKVAFWKDTHVAESKIETSHVFCCILVTCGRGSLRQVSAGQAVLLCSL
jgi:hypothetical protein